MSMTITRFVLGPLENNSYLISDEESKQSIVIDPSFNSELILDHVHAEKRELTAIWVTHAHFDHFAGTAKIIRSLPLPIPVVLHSEDLTLWQSGGEAPQIGIIMDLSVTPDQFPEHQQVLHLGDHTFTVLYTPGHTRGHVCYYSPEIPAVFCGDVIFKRSIGRTDLSGGDYATLIHSIQTQIMTLPPQTRLFSGHGNETTVAEESRLNPFLISRNRPPESLG